MLIKNCFTLSKNVCNSHHDHPDADETKEKRKYKRINLVLTLDKINNKNIKT
jgi:hypothetical protein